MIIDESAQKWTNCQNFDPKIERIIKKISFDSRDYKSVNENILS